MAGILATVGSLILGISLIQLANGYIGTLIGIRLAAAHVEPVVAGIITSAYFAGYAAGAVLCHRLIDRAGHIRGFAAFAALVTAAFLGHPLYFDPILWAVLRAFVGFGCAGLFVATESWLNAKATAATRGTVFAIYMVATYATFAGGQFVLNLAAPSDFSLFALAAILFCVALVLVAMTRAEQPVPVPSGRLKGRRARGRGARRRRWLLRRRPRHRLVLCACPGLRSVERTFGAGNLVLYGARDHRRPTDADSHRQAV